MSTNPTCIRCGQGFTTQEGLHGEVLETAEGLMHEHCGDEFEVAENERRREHGDVLIEWKTAADLPPDAEPGQAERYRQAFAQARGKSIHEQLERAVRGDA